jgi:hypothetical protein
MPVTPERRARYVEALRRIRDAFWIEREGGGATSVDLEALSDLELVALLGAVELFVDYAQGTDI